MNSAINVIGTSSLINKNEVSRVIDIKDIENEFINKNSYFNKYSIEKSEEYTPIEDYQNKLKNIDHSIPLTSSYDELSDAEPVLFDKSPEYYPSNDFDETKSILSQMNDLDKDLSSLSFNNFTPPPNKTPDPYLVKMTNEQHNQNIVNNALGDDYDENDIDFDIDQESKDEKKLMLLEKIDDIRGELTDEGINIDKVPSVDHSSDLESIEYVHRVFMIKYNRHRFSGFAEEFILAGAGVMETVFNGQNDFLGLKPDLTDYSDTVRVKLRRLRHETSTIMGGVMDQYDIGPITRIMIELIPSMFLHAKLNKSQYKNNLYQDINMGSAISDIRSME
jgi:hypothetical protein